MWGAQGSSPPREEKKERDDRPTVNVLEFLRGTNDRQLSVLRSARDGGALDIEKRQREIEELKESVNKHLDSLENKNERHPGLPGPRSALHRTSSTVVGAVHYIKMRDRLKKHSKSDRLLKIMDTFLGIKDKTETIAEEEPLPPGYMYESDEEDYAFGGIVWECAQKWMAVSIWRPWEVRQAAKEAHLRKGQPEPVQEATTKEPEKSQEELAPAPSDSPETSKLQKFINPNRGKLRPTSSFTGSHSRDVEALGASRTIALNPLASANALRESGTLTLSTEAESIKKIVNRNPLLNSWSGETSSSILRQQTAPVSLLGSLAEEVEAEMTKMPLRRREPSHSEFYDLGITQEVAALPPASPSRSSAGYMTPTRSWIQRQSSTNVASRPAAQIDRLRKVSRASSGSAVGMQALVAASCKLPDNIDEDRAVRASSPGLSVNYGRTPSSAGQRTNSPSRLASSSCATKSAMPMLLPSVSGRERLQTPDSNAAVLKSYQPIMGDPSRPGNLDRMAAMKRALASRSFRVGADVPHREPDATISLALRIQNRVNAAAVASPANLGMSPPSVNAARLGLTDIEADGPLQRVSVSSNSAPINKGPREAALLPTMAAARPASGLKVLAEAPTGPHRRHERLALIRKTASFRQSSEGMG